MNDNTLIDALLGGADTETEYDQDGRRQAHSSITTPTIRRETNRRRLERIGREQSCAEQIATLPAEGEEIVMLMDGQWHGWDLVGAVLHLASPATIQHLGVATLGFNRTQAQHLNNLLDTGHIEAVTMIASEMFRDKNIPEYTALHEALTSRGQRLATTRNHAKLITLELTDGRKLVAHGSLNLRRCNSIEQVVLANAPDLHDFFRQYIEEAAA